MHDQTYSSTKPPTTDKRYPRPAPRLEVESTGPIPPGVLGMIAALALKRYAERCEDERRQAAQDGTR